MNTMCKKCWTHLMKISRLVKIRKCRTKLVHMNKLFVQNNYMKGNFSMFTNAVRRLALCLVVAGCSICGRGSETAQTHRTIPHVRLLPPRSGIYFGAFPGLGGTEDVVTAPRLDHFEAIAGKKPVWVYLSQNWMNGIVFPAEAVKLISSRGAVPFIRLMNRSSFAGNQPEPKFSLKKIASGAFDAPLRAWADGAKASRVPMMIEFGTEVNGDWFSWNGAWNGDKAGAKLFKASYRRIVRLFREQGASNVTWCFHVSAQGSPNARWNRMASYYPGDDVVDWIGVSIYGAQTKDERSSAFVQKFDPAYKELCRLSASKPLAIFEFGINEGASPVSKPDWLSQFFKAMDGQRYPRIKAIAVWHERWENADGSATDLRIDSSKEVRELFRREIAPSRYVSKPEFGP